MSLLSDLNGKDVGTFEKQIGLIVIILIVIFVILIFWITFFYFLVVYHQIRDKHLPSIGSKHKIVVEIEPIRPNLSKRVVIRLIKAPKLRQIRFLIKIDNNQTDLEVDFMLVQVTGD